MLQLDQLPEDTLTAGPASPIWPLEASGQFSVRSLRGSLTDAKFTGIPSFPQEAIWLKGVPPKVQAFCWMLCHSKIASLDNLQKRGFMLANRCALCCNNLESIDHLFFRCDFAVRVWNRISSTLSIYGPTGPNAFKVFSEWKYMNCSPSFHGGTKFVLHAFVWFIWLERNSRIFNDNPSDVTQVFLRTMLNVGRWMVAANLCPQEDLLKWHRILFDPG
ncbi:Putative ribonuclease H protein At1g65750 [Linum perenne]